MLPSLITKFSSKEIPYTGCELAPHWIYKNFGIEGNAVVCFIGKADVPLTHMVDLEDVQKEAPIYSPQMLHFLGEWFIDSLDVGILLQNLFISNTYEILLEKGLPLSKKGNDLFYKGKKLSVSIATKSALSVLFHFGINIETEGTPIPTSGLKEMSLSPQELAELTLKRFFESYTQWQKARVKVLPRV